MKKLLFIIIIGLFMSSCTRYIQGGSGGNGCGVWMPKKYTGTYKHAYTGWRYKTGVH